jgi:predicted AAA+ superfamily ATPase
MDRYLSKQIKHDSDSKIILLSGPRQCGKTTLVKSLFHNSEYLNYDLSENIESIKRKQWKRSGDAVIFDELHKMPEWKRWIKGIYDTEGIHPRLIVTGSVNMESFSKVGDSLAGRYFHFRLHPLDLKEGVKLWSKDRLEVFNRLMNYGGFPEPFLSNDESFYRRWSKTHLDVILRQDFLDIYAVRSIKSIEILLEMLKSRIASSFSYSSLAEDLQVDSKTVKNWLQLLENFYLLFKITPYHKNIARSILKEPKYYFFDIARVANKAARLENLVACALLKEIHFLEDTEGFTGKLHYLRSKDKREIDFLIVIDNKPVLCIEVKSTDKDPSKNFKSFRDQLGNPKCIQLVANLDKEFDTQEGIEIRNLVDFLAEFDLKKYIESEAT